MTLREEEYVMARLTDSIATMRAACDDAERVVRRENWSAVEKVAEVSHKLTWGRANAETGIQSALSAVQRFLERAERHQAGEPKEE